MNKLFIPAPPDATSSLITPSTLSRRHFLGNLTLASGALLLGGAAPPLAAAPSALQTQVSTLVKRMRAEGRISSSERTSWSIYDFSTRQKLVAINEDIPRQAASMIKPFVAQAFFYLADRRRSGPQFTSSVRDIMEQSIRRSSNTATNELMHMVSRANGNHGPQDVERVLKQYAPGVFRETSVVEYIPAGGRTYRNRASAHDYSRFLFALWHSRLPHARDLRDIMGLPNHDRITRGVSSIPAHVRVYDKTGSTARLCGNMGIIECQDSRGRPRPYTFIGIIERDSRTESYTSWITARSNALRSVSNLVYLYMKNQHQLV
ncbi:serine hydrolase [Rhabdochromatium marinum]|uniref:serine hydrolase n=1 Tax=Rhabdochromatium marinum TaxID=48729 RepID=UPI001906AB7C|nr:serine hydrolase [Rhabdochromatium marinum]MBK1647427.1 serine hydrolase [Rhabdochromatium marinum]